MRGTEPIVQYQLQATITTPAEELPRGRAHVLESYEVWSNFWINSK
jgi:hypothetical protein